MARLLLTCSLLYALAAAAPFVQPNNAWNPSSTSAGQSVFKFPLANGFPNIQIPSSALTAIEQQAMGTLPNSPLPKSLAVRAQPLNVGICELC